jgi:hypothetical protein
MDGEKAHVIGLHIVVFYQAVTDRRSRRPEGSFGADLDRHDDKPRQRVDDQFDIIQMRRRGRAQLGVFKLFFSKADCIGKADCQLVVAGAAGIHAAGFLLNDTPKPLRDFRIGAGQVAQHGYARHRGAKLIVLDRPGTDLVHGSCTGADRFQERMFDAYFGERLNVFFELVNEFLACHVRFLPYLRLCVIGVMEWWSVGKPSTPKTPSLSF